MKKNIFFIVIFVSLNGSVGCAQAPVYLVPSSNGSIQQVVGAPPSQLVNRQQGGALEQASKSVSPYVAPLTNVAPQMRGCIRIEGSLEKIPQLRILFNGSETMNNSEGFFSFPLTDRDIEKYHLVIAKNIEHHIDKTNTLKNVGVVPDKNYRYFSFKRTGMSSGSWMQQEKLLNKKNFIIPERSIVLLVDPKYVERVEVWNVDLSSNAIKLPCIVLKRAVDQNKLKRTAAKSLLYSLDTKTFHESIKETTQKSVNNPKVMVALSNPS